MNLTIAALGFLMIVIGAAVGFYPVSLLGVFVLIAALLVPSQPQGPKRQPAPQQKAEAPTRISPPMPVSTPSPQPSPQPAPQMGLLYSAQTMFPQESSQGYTSNMALFPLAMFPPMFPSMGPAAMYPQPAEHRQLPEKVESTNELVEMAAIVVLLKMLSG